MNQPPLILHTDWSASWGGQEIRTLTELVEMRRLGFRVAAAAPGHSELGRRCQDLDIPFHALSFSSKFSLPAWRDLLVLLRRLRPTVVNTHSSEDSWMAGAAARTLGVPLVLRTRHVLADISSAVSYNCFPHAVLACSRAIRDGLAAQGVHPDKIHVRPTGIDPKRFRFREEDRRQVRAELGIADHEVVVGNVGFLRIYKGQKFIVDTAARLCATPGRREFRFLLVGGGQDHGLLSARIQELDLGDRVIITGHREDVERYFSAFDILFFASFMSEGIAQSFIQGLLHGLPVLACNTPSILEPLALAPRFRLIEHGDTGAACQALEELAQARMTPDMRERQRRAVIAEYGIEAMMRGLLDLYAAHGVRPPGEA